MKQIGGTFRFFSVFSVTSVAKKLMQWVGSR